MGNFSYSAKEHGEKHDQERKIISYYTKGCLFAMIY